MSLDSVNLSRFGVGGVQLDAALLTPLHKSRIESCLSRYLLKHPSSQANIRVEVTKDPDLKEVARIIRYYQHMGLLPTKKVDPKEAELRERATRAGIRAMHQASVPGVSGQIIAGVRIAEDTLSVTRNLLSALPPIGEDNPVISHLGYYAGAMWSFFGTREWMGGREDLKRAKKIHDEEGTRRALARITSGAIVGTASAAYLSGKVFDTFGISQASLGSLAMANILFGLGSLLAFGMSTLGWIRCRRFDKRLSEYLENPHLTEWQKIRGALWFLKDAVSVTPEEMADLRAKIEKKHGYLSSIEKENLLQRDLTHLTESKVKYLKRRTSVKGLRLIMQHVDSLLDKLGDEQKRPEAIKEAALLLQKIQNETRVKTSLHILSFIAGMISFVAMAISALITGGALTFVLYGVSGAIYLCMEIYNTAALFKRKDHDDLGIELHPIQELIPLDGHANLV